MNLTIFFNGQFWVGLIERYNEGRLYSSIYTFGEEPKDGTIMHFVNYTVQKIIAGQTESVNKADTQVKKINPKRINKLARLAVNKNPLSTKSQEAIRLQQEKDKSLKKKLSREEKLALEEIKRGKAIDKAKQKRLGH
jgi:hypothetical protein